MTCGFTAISKQVLDQLVQARKMLSEDTLLNRWGYVQMHLDKNPLFLQEFVLPHDSETVQQEKIGVHRYCAFDPTFDGDMIIDFTKNFPMGTEEMKKFGMDIPKPRPFKSSPGQSLLGELERAFARIDRFFVSHINSVWKERDYSQQGRIDDVFSLGMKKEPVEEVPPGSSLAVFMDEPTIYLDYRNKKKFLGQVQELGRKYAGRLQFFIPTNDAVLIEHAQDCTYIDLYQQPAQAVKCLTLS